MADDRDKIPDDNHLLHRVASFHMVPNDRVPGRRRLSSGAFRLPEMSVDVEEMLNAKGLDWRFSAANDASVGLIRFTAGLARSVGQQVQHDPIPENDAHALVLGKKTDSLQRKLRDGCHWVKKPDDVD
jgi:hypothetical protein